MFLVGRRSPAAASCQLELDANSTLNEGISGSNYTVDGQASLTNGKPCFIFYPKFTGRAIAKERLYKTLVYSYAWADHEWRGSEHAKTGDFIPKNLYGLQIISSPNSREQIHEQYVGWLLAEIGKSMEANERFQELTAIVWLFGHLFSTVTVVYGPATLNGNATIPDDPTLTSRSNSGEPPLTPSTIDRRSGQHLTQRGSSPSSFDPTLVTSFQLGSGGLVVQNVEAKLMGTLLELSQQAFLSKTILALKAASPNRDIEANVARAVTQPTIAPKDVMDTMIDLVDWEYREERRTGLFLMVKGQAFRQSNGGESPRYVPLASINVFSPDI